MGALRIKETVKEKPKKSFKFSNDCGGTQLDPGREHSRL
jgi:hypothetical protein